MDGGAVAAAERINKQNLIIAYMAMLQASLDVNI
jgi:hypothetical protein